MTAGWSIPVKALDALTLTSTVQFSDPIDLNEVMDRHAGQTVITYATGDMWIVSLQGSLDGVKWTEVATLAVNGGPPAASSGEVVVPVIATDKPARYLRVYGQQFSTGSPVTTVWLTSSATN